jgi:hypothetical protein
MIRRIVPAALCAVLIAPGSMRAHAAVLGRPSVDSVSVGSALPGPPARAAGDSADARHTRAQAPGDTAAAPSNRFLLLLPNRYLTSTSLTFTSQFRQNADRLLGFDVYRASRFECATLGAGAGMTVGMAAGAFGMMTGAWDERSALCIGGAMTALGALYGGWLKADDPKFNLRIRLEPNR